MFVSDLNLKKDKQKEKQGKETPSQGASKNEGRQPINTLAKTQKTTQFKSFKYHKVYLHKYRKENLEQKNKTWRGRGILIYMYI